MNILIRSVAVLLLGLPLSACFGSRKDVSEFLTRAQAYLEQGDTAKARIELQNALRISPVNPQANLALAKIEEADGDYAAAVPHYVQAAAPDARLIEPQLRLGEILVDSNRLQDASGIINATVASFPDSADALALRAYLEQQRGDLAPAEADAAAALRRDPNNAMAFAARAMVQLRNRDADAALATVDKGLAKHADNLRLLQVRAAAMVGLNEPDKAVEALKAVLRNSPRDVPVQQALATIEANNGHFDAAVDSFKAAIATNPADQSMQIAFVQFLMTQNKHAEVDAYLRQLIDANPKDDTFDLALAEYYRSGGDYAASRNVLERAAARLGDDPKGLDIQVALAKVEGSRGQLGAATALVSKVLAIKPGHVDALVFRAILEQQNGRHAGAVADLLAAVKISPVNAAAYQTLASAYLAAGDPRSAIDAMQRAAALVPGDASARTNLAAFMQQGNDLLGARDIMAREVLQHPGSANVWVANARLALERKDWDTAARSLTRLKQFPNASGAVADLDGQIKMARGNSMAAMQAYQSVLDASPEVDPSAITIFAGAAIAAKQSEAAIAYLTGKITTLKGDDLVAAWLSLVKLEGDMGRVDRAEAAFNEVVKLAPRELQSYTTFLDVLRPAKRYDQAQRVITQGIAAGATEWSLLVLRAAVAEESGDVSLALRAYREALDLNPGALATANNYADLLADQRPTDLAALKDARALLAGAESSSNPAIVDTVAWVDYRLGQVEDAKALLTRINAGQSQNPQLRFHMAAVLLATGDRAGGLDLLKTTKGLEFSGAKEARALSDT